MGFLLFSFLVAAFGQPAWIPGFGILSAAFGYTFFWKGMLSFPRSRDRFLLSLIWFSAVQGIQLSWMTSMDYMGPFILIVYLFLIVAMGVQFGIISLLIGESISWHRALAIAGIWVMFEWIRLFFLCGFTWNMVGLALTDSFYSLQFAAVWGIFGLSFWVILVNLAAMKAWIENSKKGVALWLSLAAFPYFFGALHQHWAESHLLSGKDLRVALIQTNLMPEEKEFSPNKPGAYIPPLVQWGQIIDELQSLRENPIDLIVLPEAALPLGAHAMGYQLKSVPKFFKEEAFPPLKRPYALFDRGFWKVSNAFLLQTLANQSNADVITGLDDRDFHGSYNAAFHFRPQNTPYERYEKQVLVPVGEYIPLERWEGLSQFLGEQFGIYSSFKCGTEGKVFKGDVPIGISICVEETFSSLIRTLRVKGAQLMVNLTNDSWFPHSKLAQQHLDHGRVRAVENGVPVLRACNSGISCGIDCFGRSIQQILPQEKRRTEILYFTLPVRSYSTLYTWWGDSAILGISFSFAFSYFLFRKKKLP